MKNVTKKTMTIFLSLVMLLALAITPGFTMIDDINGDEIEIDGVNSNEVEIDDVNSIEVEAVVTKIQGNTNLLKITVKDENDTYIEEFRIQNNSCGEFAISGFTVYVETYGNDKIRQCYIVSSDKLEKKVVKDTIVVEGNVIELYPVYANKDEAMKEIRKVCKEFLKELQKEFKLDALKESNWQKYKEALANYGRGEDYVGREFDQYFALSSFFATYENNISNKEIIDYYNKKLNDLNKSELSIEEVLDDENLVFMLPYDNIIGEKYNDRAVMRSMRDSMSRAYNQTRAINYARAWGWGRNINAYQSIVPTFFHPNLADCTNFASQILFEGGASKQDFYPNENSGWWHHKIGNTHYHSISWVNADTFKRYMGSTFNTKSFVSFSTVVRIGDFIGFDSNGDGKVDHVGFIVDKDTIGKNWNDDGTGTLNFYNFAVSQHSTDYVRWVGGDKDNGWEKGHNKYTYYLIRR
jgi:hypothetical protein